MSTVGEKNVPSRVPPVAIVAPPATARETWSSRFSAAVDDESGPSGPLPSPMGSLGETSAIAAVNFSRNAS